MKSATDHATVFKLIEQSGFPKGVAYMVNGAKETVDAILYHPAVHAITFVGSSNVVRYIYSGLSRGFFSRPSGLRWSRLT